MARFRKLSHAVGHPNLSATAGLPPDSSVDVGFGVWAWDLQTNCVEIATKASSPRERSQEVFLGGLRNP